MTFIELFVPRGALNDDQRTHVSQRLITELFAGPGASDLIARARALVSLVIHEPNIWTVGGRTVNATKAPRYVVRVSVPGGHLNGAMRAEMVTRITRMLADYEEIPERLYQEPDAWVQIIEVPDGNLGMLGRIQRTADIINRVTHGAGSPAPVDSSAKIAPATVVDPICGMTVALSESALTLTHDGTTYAFCCAACRDAFAAGVRVRQGSSVDA